MGETFVVEAKQYYSQLNIVVEQSMTIRIGLAIYVCKTHSQQVGVAYKRSCTVARHSLYVTRFVKTRHNCTSLKLQYKALNTMGENTCVLF